MKVRSRRQRDSHLSCVLITSEAKAFCDAAIADGLRGQVGDKLVYALSDQHDENRATQRLSD